MKWFLAVFMFLSVFGLAAQDYPEWSYVLGDSSIEYFGESSGEIELSRTANHGLHPTPGGKFVYVSRQDDTEVLLVDVEKHEEVGTTDIGQNIDSVAFSEMGDTAFVSSPGSPQIGVFAHKSGTFTPVREVEAGFADSPFAVNRRGTRVYRPGGSGLQVVYVKDSTIIEEIELSSRASGVAVSPDYREIWVIEDEGSLTVIDEGRGRIRKQAAINADGSSILFYLNSVFVLVEGGTAIAEVNIRNLSVRRRIPLRHQTHSIVLSSNNDIRALSDSGLESIDIKSASSTGFILHSSNRAVIARVVLRSGEGFACF